MSLGFHFSGKLLDYISILLFAIYLVLSLFVEFVALTTTLPSFYSHTLYNICRLEQPTSPHRDWLFNPFPAANPFWIPIVMVIPALLATILIFMDQQITAVIINRKENKLKVSKIVHLSLQYSRSIVQVMGLKVHSSGPFSSLSPESPESLFKISLPNALLVSLPVEVEYK